ncbi:MAG TPA: phytanoyl-CoA dioxygenase family protein [Reyranella sp.]|nr:phytanoyl-CoA dioxygenase family protein [Reyranella sp.]
MAFTAAHWDELHRDGYTIVSHAIEDRLVRDAAAAAEVLNASHPDGGWKRTADESWREIWHCPHPAFVAIVETVLDPLAEEILESVQTPDRIQFASTTPGFVSETNIRRHFHIDGGRGPSLAAFNFVFGVALTNVSSNTAGGFHVLPGSHDRFAEVFRSQVAPVHWGNVKIATQDEILKDARMVVPRLSPGDIIVAHSFLGHGTSSNTTNVRRDMIFQRRAAKPLADPATQAAAREAFMRDHWSFFRARGS